MTTRKCSLFVLAVVLWTGISTTLLATVGVFSLELLVVVAFVGLLLTAEMTAPTAVVPEWRTTVRRFLLVGGLVVAVIVGQRFLQILQPLSG